MRASGSARRRAPRIAGAPRQRLSSRRVHVDEHTAEIDGQPVFWRSRPATPRAPIALRPRRARAAPTTGSRSWSAPAGSRRTCRLRPLRQARPPRLLDRGVADFLERFLALVGVERVRLVVHDWGAVGLAFAQRHPERIERLVIINAVPLLPELPLAPGRARLAHARRSASWRWARPRAGRCAHAGASATPGRCPTASSTRRCGHFDQGTQRAILRSTAAAAGAPRRRGGAPHPARRPALVVWGALDPYIPPRFAEAYAAALGAEC